MTSDERSGSGFLAAGGVAAILASTCCLGPLILVALGFSGAWIGNLAVLEPYRPWFIGSALIALLFAGRRVFRPVDICKTAEVCALPTTHRAYKVLFGVVAGLVVVALAFPYLARFFYWSPNLQLEKLNRELPMKRVVTVFFAVALLPAPMWAATQTTTLKVPGMTCPTCPITVKKALHRV